MSEKKIISKKRGGGGVPNICQTKSGGFFEKKNLSIFFSMKNYFWEKHFLEKKNVFTVQKYVKPNQAKLKSSPFHCYNVWKVLKCNLYHFWRAWRFITNKYIYGKFRTQNFGEKNVREKNNFKKKGGGVPNICQTKSGGFFEKKKMWAFFFSMKNYFWEKHFLEKKNVFTVQKYVKPNLGFF